MDLPPAQAHVAQGSWLSSHVSPDGDWGAGCLVCASQNMDSPFARFEIRSLTTLSLTNFQTHVKRSTHIAAVRAWAQVEVGPSGTPIGIAPTDAEFLAAWSSLVGKTVGTGQADTNSKTTGDTNEARGHHKRLRLLWCLAESMKTIDQTFIS